MDIKRLTADWRPPLSIRLGYLALAGLAVCYTVVFVITTGDTWSSALLDAAINVVPIALWGGVFFAFNRRWILHRRLAVQAPVHVAAAAAFATLWYFTVTILLGWRDGDFAGSFSVRPFSSIAFVWQMFQGIVTYALVAALALIDLLVSALRDASKGSEASTADDAPPDRRILVRVDDELVPVAVEDIVCIERAGDYAQLVTTNRRHLTRKSLAELERQLPTHGFVRVHRAHLINLDALEAAEPIGGGRMRVRLRGGIEVDTSRNGGKALRERAG